MKTYMMLMKFTTPGVEAIKSAHAARTAGKRAAKALGINWKHQYLIMGEYDILTILEAPDEETVARFALLGAMTGSFSTQTMRAFSEREADELIKGLPAEPPA